MPLRNTVTENNLIVFEFYQPIVCDCHPVNIRCQVF